MVGKRQLRQVTGNKEKEVAERARENDDVFRCEADAGTGTDIGRNATYGIWVGWERGGE